MEMHDQILASSALPHEKEPCSDSLDKSLLDTDSRSEHGEGKNSPPPPPVGNSTPAVLPCLYPVTCLANCLAVK